MKDLVWCAACQSPIRSDGTCLCPRVQPAPIQAGYDPYNSVDSGYHGALAVLSLTADGSHMEVWLFV